MQKLNDLSRSLTALEPDGTLIAVIEMSLSSWLVAGIVPGVERQMASATHDLARQPTLNVGANVRFSNRPSHPPPV